MKKKVLLWPLYNLGIESGPPRLPPKVLNRFGAFWLKLRTVASRTSFWKYSKRVPWKLFVPPFVVNGTSASCENSALLLKAVIFSSAIPSDDGYGFAPAVLVKMLAVEMPSTE